jgi:hypothetical protein
MSAWLVVGLAAGVVLLVLVTRARRYSRLFSDEHWRELGRGMVGVKAAALARLVRAQGDEPAAPDDPRILTTSAGLAVVYTVSDLGESFVHHCSVSVVGGPTAHAVGSSFALFVAKLLGLPLAELRCEVAASRVHHIELSVDAGRHAALAAAALLDMSGIDLPALRREVLESRALVSWQTPANRSR